MFQAVRVFAQTILKIDSLLFTPLQLLCTIIVVHYVLEESRLLRTKDAVLLGNFAHSHFTEV